VLLLHDDAGLLQRAAAAAAAAVWVDCPWQMYQR
jgi:hypothetical protein